jgi:D-sedoheptulose 7-phosphate isomerase
MEINIELSMATNAFEEYLINASQSISNCKRLEGTVFRIISTCVEQIKLGQKLLWFGNGGSASDALHLSTELVGKFRLDRVPIPSICLNTNVSLLTAISNDYGYENVFKRQVQALGNPGDVCIGISTSGQSESVILGLMSAKKQGLITIAFTGESPCELWKFSDLVLPVPSVETCHIQECHITIGQYICMEIEKQLFGINDN